MYLLVLGVHLFATVATGGAIIYALQAIVRSKIYSIRPAAVAIAGIAAFEVVSGVLLTTLSPEISATKLGSHIAFYLGMCLTVEAALFIKAETTAWTS